MAVMVPVDILFIFFSALCINMLLLAVYRCLYTVLVA